MGPVKGKAATYGTLLCTGTTVFRHDRGELPLRPERPRQQAFDRFIDGFRATQDVGDRI
jgi:hypothetical protein